ncbi:hypothetical protein H257_07091 [Aphanomyces astaci]|uniref:Uncharacterized protein n=1 Tax=Aphanomyces astaci TaxID=112090 RepID=W4GJJ7_APHAT|nr:hypothetical protein H257_07091 [Aphanomyces astaci]ETV79880.1 hypothetical protein H257_07091 [Aphanomyces astaci]|eukprot:XP_009830816.1 hypothetical protein H257_07091 [Aphanomyces astaci]
MKAATSPARRTGGAIAVVGDVSPPRMKKEVECPGAPKKKKRTKVRTFPRLILHPGNEGEGVIANPAAMRSLEDELRVAAPPDVAITSPSSSSEVSTCTLLALVATSSTASVVRSPIVTRSSTSLATRLSTPSHLRSPATPNLRRVSLTMAHNAPSPDTSRHVVPRPGIAPLPMADLNACTDSSSEDSGAGGINPNIPSRAMTFNIPPPMFLH